MRHLKPTKQHARKTKRHAGINHKFNPVIWWIVGAVLGILLAILVFKPFDATNKNEEIVRNEVAAVSKENTSVPVEPQEPTDQIEPQIETTAMAPPVDVVTPEAKQIESEMSWVNDTMKKYGVYANPITRFVFNHVPEGCDADACTLRESVKYEDGKEELVRVTIYFAKYKLSEYLLFHEIAHTKGILDECLADEFAAKVLGTNAGSGFYDCSKKGN